MSSQNFSGYGNYNPEVIPKLFKETFDGFKGYLDDEEEVGYCAEYSWAISAGPELLLVVMANKIAQQHGIDIGINFSEEGAQSEAKLDRPYVATVSFRDGDAKKQRDELWSVKPSKEVLSLKGVMSAGSPEEYLEIVWLLNQGLDVNDPQILAQYPSSLDFLELYKMDRRLALRLVGFMNLREFANGSSAPHFLQEPTIRLLELSCRVDPSEDNIKDLADAKAEYLIASVSRDCLRTALEEVVLTGYPPLEPEEYRDCTARILGLL